MTLIHTLRDMAAKRAAYARTRRELRDMRVETAIDLGLFREDAALTAYRKVYG